MNGRRQEVSCVTLFFVFNLVFVFLTVVCHKTRFSSEPGDIALQFYYFSYRMMGEL